MFTETDHLKIKTIINSSFFWGGCPFYWNEDENRLVYTNNKGKLLGFFIIPLYWSFYLIYLLVRIYFHYVLSPKIYVLNYTNNHNEELQGSLYFLMLTISTIIQSIILLVVYKGREIVQSVNSIVKYEGKFLIKCIILSRSRRLTLMFVLWLKNIFKNKYLKKGFPFAYKI